MMDTQTPQPEVTGSESSQTTGVSTDSSHNGTQHERSHQLVHHNATYAASKHMTQDANSKIVRKTWSSMNKKQHGIACEYLHTVVNGREITV